jgi:hypothetical protein
MCRTMSLVVCLIAFVVSGCGDKDSPTGPSSPQPQVVTVTGTVSSLGFTQHDITILRAGTMTLTLTWTAGPDLDLYLTASSCNSYPPLGPCQMLSASDGVSMPEQIQRTVASGETFKAWVDNFDLSPVNYTLSLRVE